MCKHWTLCSPGIRFQKKGAIKMQQVCYLLETGLLRSKQNVMYVYLFILCIYYTWLTSHSDLNNVLAFTCTMDPIICCIVNTHNLGFWLHSLAPTKSIGPNENLQSTVLTIISKFALNLRRWRKVLSDMLYKAKDFEINRETCLPQDATTPNRLLKWLIYVTVGQQREGLWLCVKVN